MKPARTLIGCLLEPKSHSHPLLSIEWSYNIAQYVVKLVLLTPVWNGPRGGRGIFLFPFCWLIGRKSEHRLDISDSRFRQETLPPRSAHTQWCQRWNWATSVWCTWLKEPQENEHYLLVQPLRGKKDRKPKKNACNISLFLKIKIICNFGQTHEVDARYLVLLDTEKWHGGPDPGPGPRVWHYISQHRVLSLFTSSCDGHSNKIPFCKVKLSWVDAFLKI